MISEKDFEDIICKYPDLIEEGLTFKGRQLTLYGRRMDILFEDKFKRKLIIELKVGPIKDEHIGQILSYEGMLLSVDDPTIRIMLISNRVPPNIRRSLDHHGIAWKEITVTKLKEFLNSKNDEQFQETFQDEPTEIKRKTYSYPVRQTKKEGIPGKEGKEYTVDYYLGKVEDANVLKRINELREKIKGIDQSIEEYCRKGWIQFKTTKVFCGIDVYKRHFIIFIKLPRDKVHSNELDIADLKDKYYVKIKVHPNTNLNILLKYINQAYEESLIAIPEDRKPALFIPVEEKWIQKAFECFANGSREKIYFFTNVNISSIANLNIKHIYFKLKGKTEVSVMADFIELLEENPSEHRLPGSENELGRYYYGYKNLEWLKEPVELGDLEYFKTGKKLRNDVPGACIIVDPFATEGSLPPGNEKTEVSLIETKFKKESSGVWIFQTNPKYFKMIEKLKYGSDMDPWQIMRFGEEIKKGDTVLVWIAGQDAGIYAVGEVISEPAAMLWDDDKEGLLYSTEESKQVFKRSYIGAWVQYKKKFIDKPILREYLKDNPVLKNLSVIKQPQGTNFRVTHEEWEELKKFLSE